jgi:hypothetical protein
MTDETFAMAQMILPHNQSKISELEQLGIHQQTRNIQQLQLKALMQQGLHSQNSGMFSPQAGRIHHTSMGPASLDFDAALANDTMHYGMSELVSAAYEKDSNAAFESYHKTFMLPTGGRQDLANIRLTRKFDGKTMESGDDHDDYQPLTHKEFTPNELNHMHMLNVGFGDDCLNERL